MANEIELYGSSTALIEQKRNDYIIKGTMGGTDVVLKRDIDFTKIPKTKSPSLTKAGAETICKAYGVFQRFEIVKEYISEDPKSPSFTFIVRCDLVKINPQDGKEWVVAQGFGGASTNEKSNGFAGTYDSFNKTIKMAEKRSKVDASINLAGASSLFSQDMENENFLAKSEDIYKNEGDDAPITAKQTKRIFALAAQAGYSTEEAKNKIKAMGFESTKAVTQGKYDEVCKAFEVKE